MRAWAGWAARAASGPMAASRRAAQLAPFAARRPGASNEPAWAPIRPHSTARPQAPVVAAWPVADACTLAVEAPLLQDGESLGSEHRENEHRENEHRENEHRKRGLASDRAIETGGGRGGEGLQRTS